MLLFYKQALQNYFFYSMQKKLKANNFAPHRKANTHKVLREKETQLCESVKLTIY